MRSNHSPTIACSFLFKASQCGLEERLWPSITDLELAAVSAIMTLCGRMLYEKSPRRLCGMKTAPHRPPSFTQADESTDHHGKRINRG